MLTPYLYEKEKAFDCAVSSVEMEGYSIPEYQKELCWNVITGSLSKEEYIKIMLKRCKS